MSLPTQVDAALGAFRELTTLALPAEARAQRLRTEVLLPLARHYAEALQEDDRQWNTQVDQFPYHARATFAGARACLVILGNGRGRLGVDVLREVLRLGERFCATHLRILQRQDPTGHDKLSRLSLAQLHATMAMMGAEAADDLEAAARARQRFADLGDESAVSACDHLIVRLGGTLDPADDPLRTAEMKVVSFALLTQPEAPARPAVTSTEALAAMPVDTPVDTAPTLPMAVVIVPPEALPPAAPAPPPLRPVRRERRADEAQRPTVLTAVWPPARNDRIHALATLAVLTVLCTGGLLAFSAARRAAQAHRATRAAEAPERTAPLRRVDTSPPAPTAPPTFSVALSPPTAASPAPAASQTAAPPSAGPATDAAPRVDPAEGLTVGTAPPLDASPFPGEKDEPPRVRARRLNTEGFRAYEAGDRATALAQYRKATQADPSFALPWYNLACIEALDGRADASLEALETFHRIDPEVDVRQRVETDRDFARIRDQPQFRKGLEGVLRPAPPQVPTAR